MDVSGAGGQGANIQIWASNNSKAQRWKLEHLGHENWGNAGGVYRLTPKHNTKLCADVAAPYKDNATIHAWTYDPGRTSQMWTIRPVGNGYYQLRNIHSGQSMHTWNPWDKIKSGDNVQQISWINTDKKNNVFRWKLVVP